MINKFPILDPHAYFSDAFTFIFLTKVYRLRVYIVIIHYHFGNDINSSFFTYLIH